MIPFRLPFVKIKPRQNSLPRSTDAVLLLAEGLAVGTLVHGGIHLMGADHNAVQRAVVLITAVMGALTDGAFDALVSMVVHGSFLLCLNSGLVYPSDRKAYSQILPILLFESRYDMV
jgi:hypothetical protein